MRSLGAHLAASAWLMLGTLVAGGLSYFALVVSARLLGAAEFGLLGALLGVNALITTLLRPLVLATTQLTIDALRRGGDHAVRALLGPAIASSVICAAIILVALLVFADPVARALQTSGTVSIALLAPLLGANLCFQLTTGIIAGLQRFSWQAHAMIADSAARAIATPPLVTVIGLPGSIVAYVSGQAAATCYIVARLKGVAWRVPRVDELLPALRTGVPALSLVVAITLMQSGDLVLIRSYVEPVASGLYAACASLGNLLVALAGPLYVPAFPRALAAYQRNESTNGILFTVLVPAIAGGVIAIVSAAVFGRALMRLLFGASFESGGEILPIYFAKSVMLIVLGSVGQHAIATGEGRHVHTVLIPAVGGMMFLLIRQPEPAAAAGAIFVAAVVAVLWPAIAVALKPGLRAHARMG